MDKCIVVGIVFYKHTFLACFFFVLFCFFNSSQKIEFNISSKHSTKHFMQIVSLG